MEIKGTAVKSTELYIKENFEDRYEEWLELLPEESKKYFVEGILAGKWYPLKEGVLEPTDAVGVMFYKGDSEKAAYEIGRFSAFYALKGIYKIFVKIASVDFVLKRTSSIFSTYYSGGYFDLVDRQEKKIEFKVRGFVEGEELIFHRIAGWVEGIFEVILAKPEDLILEYKKNEENFLEAKIVVYLK